MFLFRKRLPRPRGDEPVVISDVMEAACCVDERGVEIKVPSMIYADPLASVGEKP